MKTNVCDLIFELVEYAVKNGLADPLDFDMMGRAAFLRFAEQI